MKFQSDEELFQFIEKKLFSAAFCDIMDGFGFRDQAMHPRIRPIHPDYIVIGRAKTALCNNVYEPRQDNPYKGEIDAVDTMNPGEVLVQSTDLALRGGLWGELMSTASKKRGSRGAVLDGACRDIKKIYDVGFPVFAAGYRPTDSNGRCEVVDMDCPVMCGGVRVNPGELIVADFDGIVVIPQEIEDDVIQKAIEKAEKESICKKELDASSFAGFYGFSFIN